MINPPRNNMEGVGAAVSLQRAESPFFFFVFWDGACMQSREKPIGSDFNYTVQHCGSESY